MKHGNAKVFLVEFLNILSKAMLSTIVFHILLQLFTSFSSKKRLHLLKIKRRERERPLVNEKMRICSTIFLWVLVLVCLVWVFFWGIAFFVSNYTRQCFRFIPHINSCVAGTFVLCFGGWETYQIFLYYLNIKMWMTSKLNAL